MPPKIILDKNLGIDLKDHKLIELLLGFIRDIPESTYVVGLGLASLECLRRILAEFEENIIPELCAADCILLQRVCERYYFSLTQKPKDPDHLSERHMVSICHELFVLKREEEILKNGN